MKKIWYKGNWVNSDIQIYKTDKFFKWKIEPIEINDETVEQKRREIAEFYGIIKISEERKKKND